MVTPQEMADASVWLLKNHIPSVGPLTATALLRIRTAIAEVVIEDPLPEIVEKYRDALGVVCGVLAGHQHAVIETLDMLVKLGRTDADENEKN